SFWNWFMGNFVDLRAGNHGEIAVGPCLKVPPLGAKVGSWMARFIGEDVAGGQRDLQSFQQYFDSLEFRCAFGIGLKPGIAAQTVFIVKERADSVEVLHMPAGMYSAEAVQVEKQGQRLEPFKNPLVGRAALT